MQEFSSISVSSYEAGSLAERLTEQSHDGWSVVAIVPTGSTVTAYLCREADAAAAAASPAAEPVSEPAPEPVVSEPAAEPAPAVPSERSADTEPALAAIVPEPVSAPAEEPAAEPTPTEPTEIAPGVPTSSTESTTSSTETAATAGAAPAGWYADPSGRFELRYWDGGQWTEHVSRAGQQYTDPPVA